MNLGTPEVIVCLLIALVVLGPDKLPTAARQLGRALAEVKKLTSDVQGQVHEFINSEDEKPQSPGGPVAATPAAEPKGLPSNAPDFAKAPNPPVETFDSHPDPDGFRLIGDQAPTIPPEVTPTPAARSQLAQHLERVKPTAADAPAAEESTGEDGATSEAPSPWRTYDRDPAPRDES